MKLQFISEQELEKINFIFTLMNQIYDSYQENFIIKIYLKNNFYKIFFVYLYC